MNPVFLGFSSSQTVDKEIIFANFKSSEQRYSGDFFYYFAYNITIDVQISVRYNKKYRKLTIRRCFYVGS